MAGRPSRGRAWSSSLRCQTPAAEVQPGSGVALAAVTLEKVDDGFTITEVYLDLVATVPGAERATFEMLANKAKTGCPVSKLLNAKITLSMKLES